MAQIYNNLTEFIGKTPLVRIDKIANAYGAEAEVLAKVELFNPGGSVKDRVALNMIEDAEKKGTLKPGATIIEPTSGNTGVGLAWISRIRGYKAIIVMPDTMSRERQMLLKAAGAELVLTPGAEGMKGSIEEAERLQRETPGAIILGQFTNPANVEAHVKTTAEEIWADTGGKVDIFVAGVGTGGTVTGVAKGLKAKNPNVKVVAVEPASSPMISEGKAGAHKIQGIGANFVPDIYDPKYIDEVLPVKNEDALLTGRQLSLYEGMMVGISSGAAAYAALTLAKRPENKGKRIICLLPDTGERYLSTELYQ